MGDFIKGLGASIGYGADPKDSSSDLEMYKRQALSNSKYDELAKARGFKSGDEMVQFYRNQGLRPEGSVRSSVLSRAANSNSIKDATMMHPKNLFDYIGRAFSQATNGD